MIVRCTEVVSGIWMKVVEVGGGVEWNKVAAAAVAKTSVVTVVTGGSAEVVGVWISSRTGVTLE